MQGADQEQGLFGRMEVAVRTILSPSEGGRQANEDNYLVVDTHGTARFLQDQREVQQEIAHWTPGHVRLAILDGMGGHSYGREAAERTVKGILQIEPTANIGALSDQLDALHRKLHREMHMEGAEPGCTLSLLEIPPTGQALLYHVGDSRLYRVDDEIAEYLTIDHIPATKLALYSLIDRDEWFRQTHQTSTPQISQAFVLGNGLSNPEIYNDHLGLDLYELHDGNLPSFLRGLGDRRLLQLEPGVVYLLASDGFWHLPQPQAFIRRWPEILMQTDKSLDHRLDDLFAELIRQTRQDPQVRGDNSTALLFRIKP